MTQRSRDAHMLRLMRVGRLRISFVLTDAQGRVLARELFPFDWKRIRAVADTFHDRYGMLPGQYLAALAGQGNSSWYANIRLDNNKNLFVDMPHADFDLEHILQPDGTTHLAILNVTAERRYHGIGRKLLQRMVQQHEVMGTNRLTLSAADDGSVAWARMGFLPADAQSWQKLSGLLDGRLAQLQETTGRGDPFRIELRQLRAALPQAGPEFLWHIADHPRAGRMLGQLPWAGHFILGDPRQQARLWRYGPLLNVGRSVAVTATAPAP